VTKKEKIILIIIAICICGYSAIMYFVTGGSVK
jgi:hypothetical protein